MNEELPCITMEDHAAFNDLAPKPSHNRQFSTTSTLPILLRSHISEPVLRDRYLKPYPFPPNYRSLEESLIEFKKLQSDNSWNFLISSREIAHANEISDLCDDHEYEIRYLKFDLEKAKKRNGYFEARIKKEVVQKLAAKEALKTLQEQSHVASTQYQARIRELTDCNLELVTVVSSMAAKEATHKENLNAKINELEFVKDYLRGVLVKAKEEIDHSHIKIQNLQYALDGTSMAEDVDVKGHLELKKQQVKDLLTQIINLSTELDRVESEAVHRDLMAERGAEKCMQRLRRAQSTEAHFKALLEVSNRHKNDYLFLLNSDLRASTDAQLQAANKVLENFGEEMNMITAAKADVEASLAVAEDDRLALGHLHRNHGVELKRKEEEINDLKHKNEALDGDKSYLDAELCAVTMEKDHEISRKDQTIAMLQVTVQSLHRYIDDLGAIGADARTARVWNAKIIEVDNLKESLKQAQMVIQEHEERREERHYIESLDKCLESNYDEVTRKQTEQLNLAMEESANLRLIIQGLFEAHGAHNHEDSLQEDSHGAQQQQCGCEEACHKGNVEGDSILDVRPTIAQVAGKHGFNDWDEVDDFFHAVAENVSADSALLRCAAAPPMLGDDQTMEGVCDGQNMIRRVRGEENLFALYQKTAAKGKGKSEDLPRSLPTIYMNCQTIWDEDTMKESSIEDQSMPKFNGRLK